jgi:glyoxylase-like metal-dependent hydrolase (beta-lactamase superfamily II)
LTSAVQVIVAPNPGAMTLEGTNTYLVGRDPTTVIDPGPEIPEHIEAVRAAGEARGGIGTVLATHSHQDHVGGAELLGISAAAPADGELIAGMETILTPGHAEDHRCFLSGRDLFCGDLILGEGSTIVPPAVDGGSLAKYMASLERISQLELDRLYPGHGPVVDDPAAKIAEYTEHRLSRERRLVAALERGERSRSRLLREVWDDVPEHLLPAAAWAMQAHLEKLEAEGRLPEGLSE